MWASTNNFLLKMFIAIRLRLAQIFTKWNNSIQEEEKTAFNWVQLVQCSSSNMLWPKPVSVICNYEELLINSWLDFLLSDKMQNTGASRRWCSCWCCHPTPLLLVEGSLGLASILLMVLLALRHLAFIWHSFVLHYSFVFFLSIANS